MSIPLSLEQMLLPIEPHYLRLYQLNVQVPLFPTQMGQPSLPPSRPWHHLKLQPTVLPLERPQIQVLLKTNRAVYPLDGKDELTISVEHTMSTTTQEQQPGLDHRTPFPILVLI
jgi:hypothetical protein